MNCLKKALPSVSESQRPVIAVQRDTQLGPLPVWISVLTYRHGPALRVAAPERIHKHRKCWLQSAVSGQAKLQGDSKKHMNTVGLHPVALEGEQHSFSPGRVEPSVNTHIVAHKHSMQSNAWVAPLEQVSQLQILQVSVTLQAQVWVCRVGHGRPTGSLGQGEARVTAGASCPVLCGTGGTAGTIANRAGNEDLARWMAVGAGAAAALVTVNTKLVVFTAV